ncbi:MAG: tRNA (adenosine(37)-N6)-dimethylallyltransferase MiaA [Candidatus Paceibacterota bacterium]|jgi:tRNA dimethylallyltransferase|nr:tRNA (adenosine(37)-N6)-dimethylallyltransferase MiaA [bacterium]
MKNIPKQKLVVILGATAAGKTDLGVWLAKKYNGEVVSADSRLVYREMNIGTAKPKNESSDGFITNGVIHHMINESSLKKIYTAAVFKKRAISEIKKIGRKNKNAFLVGGTGLYIDAVVDNIDFPSILPNNELRNVLEKKTLEELVYEYGLLDPLGVERIDKNNKRRLIRAIEVCRLTGKSFWENRRLNDPIFDCLEIGIKVERDELADRIKKRINRMIKDGLQNEAINLIKKYGEISPLQTIGYQEWKDYITKEIDKKDIEEIKERIFLNTNKFSKRQITWFQKNKKIHWIKTKKEAEKLVKEFLK